MVLLALAGLGCAAWLLQPVGRIPAMSGDAAGPDRAREPMTRSEWTMTTSMRRKHAITGAGRHVGRSLKAKIRALTGRTSQQDPRDVLIRLNQIMRGWANYLKHAVQAHPALTGPIRLVAGGPVAADAVPLKVEGRPAPVGHPR